MLEKTLGIRQAECAEQPSRLYRLCRGEDLRHQKFESDAGIFDMCDLIGLPGRVCQGMLRHPAGGAADGPWA